jgi:hypothetical protein
MALAGGPEKRRVSAPAFMSFKLAVLARDGLGGGGWDIALWLAYTRDWRSRVGVIDRNADGGGAGAGRDGDKSLGGDVDDGGNVCSTRDSRVGVWSKLGDIGLFG